MFLKFTLYFKESKVWEGVAVNHWKSSIAVKLTELVVATPWWVGRRQWRVPKLCNNATSQYCNYSMPFTALHLARPSASRRPHRRDSRRDFRAQPSSQAQQCPIKLSCNYLHCVLSGFRKISPSRLFSRVQTCQPLTIMLTRSYIDCLHWEPIEGQQTGNLALQTHANKALGPIETTGRSERCVGSCAHLMGVGREQGRDA